MLSIKYEIPEGDHRYFADTGICGLSNAYLHYLDISKVLDRYFASAKCVKNATINRDRQGAFTVLGLGYDVVYNPGVSADIQKYLTCGVSYLPTFIRYG